VLLPQTPPGSASTVYCHCLVLLGLVVGDQQTSQTATLVHLHLNGYFSVSQPMKASQHSLPSKSGILNRQCLDTFPLGVVMSVCPDRFGRMARPRWLARSLNCAPQVVKIEDSKPIESFGFVWARNAQNWLEDSSGMTNWLARARDAQVWSKASIHKTGWVGGVRDAQLRHQAKHGTRRTSPEAHPKPENACSLGRLEES
jgi:hypothetical protein